MVIVAILCGGIGSRLWPLSRRQCPKQFITLPGATHNLFEQTLCRIQQLIHPCTRLVIVSNTSMKENILQSLHHADVKCPVTLIWEPLMRNTGPAIGSLIKYLQEYMKVDKETNCLVLPSDHLLSIDAFNHSLQLADQLVEHNVVTFGICPTYPEIGYGYIIEGNNHKIEQFIEKPLYERAKQLIENPSCFWNSGMFYFNIDMMIKEFQLLCPQLLLHINWSEISDNVEYLMQLYIDDSLYTNCPNIPFDKLIMEKTSNGCVVPFRGQWSDIGSWEAICQVSQNYQPINCQEVDTHNCNIYNYNPQQMIALIGVDDLCVVTTKDAILISKVSETQKVKNIVQNLPEQYT